MSVKFDYDVIVVGAGASGLTSAMYASRSGLKTVVIERGMYGGQMQNTKDIENYSGFGSITGAELSEHMYKQAIEQGVEYRYGDVDYVLPIGKGKDKYFEVVFKNEEKLVSKAVIVATGVKHRKLGVKGEEELQGRGVSYCAVCDGNFFRNKHVVVIGGGDSALEEANYLTGLVDKVTLIHRRDTFRGQKVLQDRVLNNPKIDVVLNSQVIEIVGKDKVEGVSIMTKNENGENYHFLPCDGVFIYVGLDPISEVVSHLQITDGKGYIATTYNQQTPIKGLFAVGDVTQKTIRQIATAVGDGAIAGTSVREYIDNLDEGGK